MTQKDQAFVKSLIHCGDLDMRIARDGTWFHQGSPIGRQELVKLFASVLTYDPKEDSFWLETPVERGEISVEDAPFIAVRADQMGDTWVFETNVEDRVPLDAAHPLYVEIDVETGEPRPYIEVRAGLKARLARSVYYELVHAAHDQGNGQWTVRSGGQDWIVGWT